MVIWKFNLFLSNILKTFIDLETIAEVPTTDIV